MKSLVSGLLGVFIGIAFSWLYVTIWFCPSWDSNLRFNGHDWFYYGPAFLKSIQCQTLTFKDGSRSVEITDQNKIAEIKQWIVSNGIMDRMNYAPKWPDDQPWFTASTVLPAYELRLSGDNASSSNGNTEIMTIPLMPVTLGVSGQGLQDKINELKKIAK